MKQLFINIQEPIFNELKLGLKKDIKEAIKILLDNGFVLRLHDSEFKTVSSP